MQAHSVSGLNLVSPINHRPNALYLYPTIPDWHCEPETITSTLDAIGLIADAIPDKPNCFFTGSQFLNLITFLGCAPTIQFDATHDRAEFCFIRLISTDDIKLIKTSSLSRPPHCPHCKKAVKRWQDYSTETAWECPHCANTAPAYDYDWRRTAGFARIFIEITDIYPKEAIPQPSFLKNLATHTSVDWDYFYYCA